MDAMIYAVHGAFWAAFGVTRALVRDRAPEGPAAEEERQAPWSRVILGFHFLAFGVMYWGVGQAVFGLGVPERFPGQRIAGTAAIGLGAAVSCWAVAWFRSWRFRAKVDAGHELATGGPFAWVRHPIYLGLTLLALGTLLWIPTIPVGVGFVLMAIGSDLRGRGEEGLLLDVFGDRYRDYMRRTARFLPGIY